MSGAPTLRCQQRSSGHLGPGTRPPLAPARRSFRSGPGCQAPGCRVASVARAALNWCELAPGHRYLTNRDRVWCQRRWATRWILDAGVRAIVIPRRDSSRCCGLPVRVSAVLDLGWRQHVFSGTYGFSGKFSRFPGRRVAEWREWRECDEEGGLYGSSHMLNAVIDTVVETGPDPIASNCSTRRRRLSSGTRTTPP
jgi:hypothetical protein